MNLVLTHYRDNIVAAGFEGNKNRLVSINACRDAGNMAVVGDVYIGKVKNVVKNINAAFVEIAKGELCFLQFSSRDEAKLYKNEMDIVVQVVREGIKTKQPAVTTCIELSGKYLVKTDRNQLSVSSRIRSAARKNELAEWMREIGADRGYIIRTNAEHALKEDLEREYIYLENLYEDIIRKSKHSVSHSLLYRITFAESQIRDCYDSYVDRIITDDNEIYNEIINYSDKVCPGLRSKICLYEDDSYPLGAMYGLGAKIEKALSGKVWLDSGAYLVIEPTEACTVIDINTGKAVKRNEKDREKHFFEINMEAAEELFCQISVRNLSGIIIADFIDMKESGHNDRLMEKLRQLAAADPVKTDVVDMTALGLVEITRKKIRKPLHELIGK